MIGIIGGTSEGEVPISQDGVRSGEKPGNTGIKLVVN